MQSKLVNFAVSCLCSLMATAFATLVPMMVVCAHMVGLDFPPPSDIFFQGATWQIATIAVSFLAVPFGRAVYQRLHDWLFSPDMHGRPELV